MAETTEVTRTVREVGSGIIYFTSAVYGQTMGVSQTLFPDAKPGDKLTITLEGEKPVKVVRAGHVELRSND